MKEFKLVICQIVGIIGFFVLPVVLLGLVYGWEDVLFFGVVILVSIGVVGVIAASFAIGFGIYLCMKMIMRIEKQ